MLALATGCPAEKHEATPDTTRADVEARRLPRDTAAVFARVGDADIRMLAALINASEISAGSLAARKATVADVRSFASDMVADHTAMQRSSGGDTTSVGGTTPAGRARADTLRRVSRRQADSLAALPRGAAFDRAYIDQQLSAHSMALDSLQRWAAQTRSGALRAMIGASIPKVQSHLDQARAIQASLGGMIRAAHRTGRDTAARPDTSRP
ncbi:MAG: DUF4142 domain-containing protein [Gemmatimonadaceae bacterium]